MTRLTRRYTFSASHRLHSAAMSEEENADLYGKCNNPYGHGHNYILAVTVEGEVDPESGRVVGPGALDRFVRETILEPLDHRDLNTDVPDFKLLVPTTENLAVVVGRRLHSAWPGYFHRAHLAGIHIEETKRNSFQLKIS
ncbi:MAG: 6-carboxytetrahydropterin synthase [Bryobacteraceae bacterium]